MQRQTEKKIFWGTFVIVALLALGYYLFFVQEKRSGYRGILIDMGKCPIHVEWSGTDGAGKDPAADGGLDTWSRMSM